jgi:hypothetical protein
MPEAEYDRIAAYLAHIAAGWRDWGDLETLARLPDGTVSIDILAGGAVHGTAGPVALRLAPALEASLAERLARKGIAVGTVDSATLELRMDTGAIRTDRKRIVHFDFGIEAKVGAEGREHRASRREDHVWHAREPG